MSIVFDTPPKTWDQCKNDLNPFDLVLFSGNDLISDIIRSVEYEKLSDGLISHVGMIVSKSILPFVDGLEENKLYIWECISLFRFQYFNINPVPDIQGKLKIGVQIRDLEQVIQSNNQNREYVYIGKLKNNPWIQNSNPIELQEKMKFIMNDYGNRYYDMNFFDMLSSVYKIFRPLRYVKDFLTYYIYEYVYGIDVKPDEVLGPLFCSEFVSIIYKSIQVLPEDVKPENITPIHFIKKTNIDPIPLILESIFRCQ